MQDNHICLRELVADHVQGSDTCVRGLLFSPDDGKDFVEHMKCLRTFDMAVGEDAAISRAEVCRQDIIIYLADAQ